MPLRYSQTHCLFDSYRIRPSYPSGTNNITRNIEDWCNYTTKKHRSTWRKISLKMVREAKTCRWASIVKVIVTYGFVYFSSCVDMIFCLNLFIPVCIIIYIYIHMYVY
jgi:hypothetical protein